MVMSAATTTAVVPLFNAVIPVDDQNRHIAKKTDERGWRSKASFMTWTVSDVFYVLRQHWIPCLFAAGYLFFQFAEPMIQMIPATSQPFDLGFAATRSLHHVLASSPGLITVFAGLNTVIGGIQTMYIAWTWLIEGRPRTSISIFSMFTCRGILGYSTQLPLSQEYLGSAFDVPLGNASFFFFFSGHVASTTIVSLDMKRMHRFKLARVFYIINVLQAIRLLGTRGHYTIDIAVGIVAGILFDSLAGKYEEMMRKRQLGTTDARLVWCREGGHYYSHGL